jgi:hypothetical protein
MIKRLSTAAVCFVLAIQMMPAEARPYCGYDGRNYGQSRKAPNRSRPSRPAHSVGARHAGEVSGASRSCLSSPARALLQRIEANFGPVRAISTCRAGARIAGSGRISRHASGNAVDFEAGSRKGAIVKWLIANHHAGGTMTYSGMSHIHVDIGQRFVSLSAAARAPGRARAQPRLEQPALCRARYSGSRGYAAEGRRTRDDHGSRSGGRQYASGYATIYQ